VEPIVGRGGLSIADRVVEKIAARAALEVDGVGGVPRRILGRRAGPAVPGLLPRVRARVDGPIAVLSMSISVRYPTPVSQVAAGVRAQVAARLSELCGLDAAAVHIDVPVFITRRPGRADRAAPTDQSKVV
jgi:uncharacterized alkaline shock family protein YloU